MNDDLPNMTPVGALRIMPVTAKQVATFAKGIIQSVREGNTSALEVLVMLRALQLLSKEVIEQIEDNILNEANRYSENSIELYGARIDKADTRTDYLYETAGDSQWEELDAEINTLTARKKEREAFLRAIKDPVLLVNKDGAEEMVKPPVKKTKEGVKVFIK